MTLLVAESSSAPTGAAQPVPAQPVAHFAGAQSWWFTNAVYGKMAAPPVLYGGRYSLSAGPSGAGSRAWPIPVHKPKVPVA